MKITEHFNTVEFHSRDGAPYPREWVDTRLKPLCEALEVIRNASNAPLHILSGYRSEAHNKAVGGVSNSQHLQGRAADLASRKLSPKQLHSLIEFLIKEGKIKDGGLGEYAGFVHYDQGPSRRWNG